MTRSRREFVAGAGATILGTGVLAGTGAAGRTVPRVTTFGHFDDDARLTEGNTTTNYETSGDVPGVDGPPVDDLTVVVHGWRDTQDDDEARADNDAKFATADRELAESGYGGAVIGYEWDAHRGDSPDFGWADANRIAERNGPKLARFVRDYHAKRPNAAIRIASHSLGTLVLSRTLTELDGAGDWARREPGVATVHPFGAAVDHDRPTAAYPALERAIETQVGAAYNYHSEQDSVLAAGYEPRELSPALGRHGADPDHDAPDNYTDHDVTSEVGTDHSGYLENASDLMVSHMN